MLKTCCAYACTANTRTHPNLKFQDLTTAKGSLTEWLLAINRLDVLVDITAGRKANSFAICETHFPKNQDLLEREYKTRRSVEKRKSMSKFRISPVEIVDIQANLELKSLIPQYGVNSANVSVNMAAKRLLEIDATQSRKVASISTVKTKSDNKNCQEFKANDTSKSLELGARNVVKSGVNTKDDKSYASVFAAYINSNKEVSNKTNDALIPCAKIQTVDVEISRAEDVVDLKEEEIEIQYGDQVNLENDPIKTEHLYDNCNEVFEANENLDYVKFETGDPDDNVDTVCYLENGVMKRRKV